MSNRWKIKNGETVVEAVFFADRNRPSADKFPYIAACNVALYNLPIQLQIQGVEHDLSDLSKIGIKLQNKIGGSLAYASINRSYTFNVQNGLCIDPAAPG